VKIQKLKLPFVLKAVRGGSGYGIRVIHHPEDLGRSLGLWLEQLQRNVGEVILLAERYLEGARRVVQPFARFSGGQTDLFPSMDVSLTCRFRKLIEFCPASETSDHKSLKKIEEWTKALVHRTGFVGVGSFEFLVDGTRSYLIEGIPRLNTSYVLWEKVAGTSAVAWQLATLMSDASIVPKPSPTREWASAISLRFYAEDPLLQLPQPGRVSEVSETRDWNFPGAVARFSPSISVNQELMGAEDFENEKRNPLESQFGGLLGHLWVGAEDRKKAITVARGVLDQIWIAGSLQTNERYLQEILHHPWVTEGIFHASFIDEEFIPLVRPPGGLLMYFISLAQLCASQVSPSTSVKWAAGDQWMKPSSTPPEIEWKEGPNFFEAEGRKGVSGFFSGPEGKTYRAFCYPTFDEKWLVRIGNWVFSVRRILPKASGIAKSVPKLNALVSGRVHSILFRQGTWVQAHDTVLVIESLGSLIPHALPIDVKIARWMVQSQTQVLSGQPLAELETAVKG
jgi:acetyl/propionyl-CoA carboxylase alpha subunit